MMDFFAYRFDCWPIEFEKRGLTGSDDEIDGRKNFENRKEIIDGFFAEGDRPYVLGDGSQPPFKVGNELFLRRYKTKKIDAEDEAEENADEGDLTSEGDGLSEETMQHVNHAVECWIASGGYLHAGVTSPVAAEAMSIPRYQLTAWVKASGHNSFTRWITSLRIEEAKRMLQEHADWTNEAVADHCGFSRAYFQRIFKQETGMAPSEYDEQ